MKKTLIFVSLLSLVLLLAACGGAPAPAPTPEPAPASSEPAAVPATPDPVEAAPEPALSPAEQLIAAATESLSAQLAPLPETGQGEKIGVLIISLTNPFWVNMKECYEAAGQEMGIQVEVLTGTTEGDTTSQLETLMTMATKDYDAIILSPIEGSNLIPGIIQCNQNGIPVINLGPGVDVGALTEAGGHLDGKITVKFEQQGEMVAQDMAARLSQGGQVAVLQGLPGAAQSEGRSAGFIDTAKAANLDVVAVQPCDWDATKAFDATKDLLVAYPDLRGIFSCNDVMALAAVEALKSAGREDVLVYGVDFTGDAKGAIEEGAMMGSMTYSSAVYTNAGLLMALKIVQGETLSEPVYSPLTLVTQDNVADFEGWR